MPIQQINPEIAKQILEEDSEAIYVDVRSIPEFVQGHAIRAINIPLLHKTVGGMQPNPDFERVADEVLPKDKKLLVGCMMGGRSQKACEVLELLGFQNLYNIYGGFAGARNPITGQTVQKGWAELGFPVSTENGEGVGYESLLKSIP